jgi:hypothetical protein
MAELYRVVLQGGGESVPLAEAKERLARLFAISQANTEELFSRAPIVVKNGLDSEFAQRFVEAITTCGAKARFEPMPAQPAADARTAARPAPIGPATSGAATGEQMTCPACGQSQPEAEICIFCGKVIAKVQRAMQEGAVDQRRKPRVFPELALRPMGMGEILGQSFSIFREKLLTFAGISMGVPVLLFLACLPVLGLLFYYAVGPHANPKALGLALAGGVATGGPAAAFGLLWLLLVTILLFAVAAGFVGIWSHSALTYAISERHLGHAVAVIPSYKFTLRRLPSVYWTMSTTYMPLVLLAAAGLVVSGALIRGALGLLLSLAVALGTTYFALKYALIDKIVILEGLTGGEARSRSAEILEGNIWRLIGIIVVAGLIVGAASLAAEAVYAVLGTASVTAQVVAQALISIPLGTFGIAYPAIALCLFYYDVRLRHDGSLTHKDLARNL